MDVLVEKAFDHPWPTCRRLPGELFQKLVGRRWYDKRQRWESRFLDKMRGVVGRRTGAEFVRKKREEYDRRHRKEDK